MSTYSKLLENFSNRGNLLLPDEEFYSVNLNNQSIELIAKKIFVWLGIKPRNVSYSASNEIEDRNKLNSVNIINISHAIPRRSVSVEIAKKCIEYYFDRNKLTINPEAVEKALLDYGLGLLVINSYEKNSFGQLIHNLFKNNDKENQTLKYLNYNEFFLRFNDYVTINELNTNVILEHTFIRNRGLLNLGHNESKMINEAFVITENSNSNKKFVKTVILIFALCGIFLILMLLYSNKKKDLPIELITQKEEISVLEESYRNCINSLQIKQHNIDSQDIYAIRQLQSHFTRCTSIKNKYEFNIQEYNRKIDNL